jgi:hypothetical protein
MVCRLYRRDPIVAGRWYYAFRCKGCNALIHSLDDSSNGQSPCKFGGGQFNVPCLACGHDDLYQVSDILHVQAERDGPGGRPSRIAPSKSSRKPLVKAYPHAKATFGVGYIEDRPAAAAIVARIITSWADIEVQCGRLLAELMGTNVPAAAAVFGSLRSSRAQHDALEAAAKVVLDERDYELFAAHMARRNSLEKERNDLAHGCYGVSVSIQEHIIWVSQVDYIIFMAESARGNNKIDNFRKKQFVYELGILERIAQEIEEFYHQIGFFTGYLWARHGGPQGASFRATRYPQLCNQPHISQALDQIRLGAKKNHAAPSALHHKERCGKHK